MKFLVCFVMFAFSAMAFASTSPKCPGEEGYYYTNYRRTNNPQEGGFVSYTATVQDSSSIVIGKLAAVCGNALIFDSANLSGTVLVRGNAEVSDSAIITGDVILEGDVVVKGKSIIRGRGTLSTGVFEDARHEVTPSAKQLIAEKIQKYFLNGNLNIKDGLISSVQTIEFTGDPCSDNVKLKRSNFATNGTEFISSTMQEFIFNTATEFLYVDNSHYHINPFLRFNSPSKFTLILADGPQAIHYLSNIDLSINNKVQYDLILPMFDDLVKACKL